MTVRLRVTALAMLATLVVLTAAAVALVVVQRRVLLENIDESLAEGADAIAAAYADGRLPSELGGFGDDDTVGRVVADDGEVLASTPGPADAGDDARTVDRRLDGATVHLEAPVDDVGESTTVLAASLAVAVPAVVAVLGALVWWLVGRTLRPVEAIRRQVAAIGGSDLDRRVPEPPGGDEIARLASTMNGMLDRLEDSARRQQRFVADASHELRNPLTRMRTELEVDLAHPERADLAATHRSVLDETAGMQHLVEDLLHLARSDADAAVRRDEEVDVDDVVLRQARRLRADGRVAVDTTGVAAARVRGDAAQLGRALANLADNAARHARSIVTFTVTEADGVAVVSVADDGTGIPANQRERVFDRFTRLDEARAGGAGGAGLGLAIARDVVERHGGTVTVDDRHTGPGARFLVRLPLDGLR